MKRRFSTLFIGLAMGLLAACDPAPRTVMGPVRLAEACPAVPKEMFTCRPRPPRPVFGDPAKEADAVSRFINALWFSQADCEAKLEAAGEMQRGRDATE